MNVDLAKLRSATNDRRVHQVISALEVQPLLRLPELAVMVALSPSRLRSVFKRETDACIKLCSLEIRLQHAERLLLTTCRSIKEIRNEVGIPDGPNFVRYFKKRFLKTPSAYRVASGSRFDEQTVD